MIAMKADGALRDALSIFDRLLSFGGSKLTYKAVIENLHILDYDYFFKVTEQIINGNISQALLILDEILSLGFDGHHFIAGLSTHFRNLLVCKDAVTVELLEVSESIREKYLSQSQQCKAALLFTLLEEANRCDIYYREAQNQRLHVELSLLKMCAIAQPSLTAASAEKKKSSVEEKKSEAVSSKQEAEKTYEVNATATAVVQEQEPVPVKPVVPSASGIRQTISIKEPVSVQQPQAQAQEAVSSSLLEASGLAEILDGTVKPLQQLWNMFAERLFKQGKMSLHSAMTKRMPEWSDEKTISFFVDNASLEKDFNLLKPDVMEHLRKAMRDPLLSLNIEVAKDEHAVDKPYSSVDKFKWLAERNPKLNEMKKLFDLDVD